MALKPRLSRKTLLLLKHETTFNVDAAPDAANDAMYVESPQFMADLTVLERNNTKITFSKTPHAVGRKLAKIEFTMEVRSNGKATGLVADRCQFGRAIMPCGFEETARTGGDAFIGPIIVDEHVNEVSWSAVTGSYSETEMTNLFLEVTTAGASGVAEITVTSDNTDLIPDQAAAVVTTDTPFTLGGGLTITPTFTGSLELGQSWSFAALPSEHLEYAVSSDDTAYPSATLYLYKDGNLHILTGAYGTVAVDGEVNGYAKAKFTFIGQYYDMTKVALPASPVYEKNKPAQIELARLRVRGYDTCVAKFSVDAGVVVTPRLCANGSDGYDGTYISDRNVTGGIDPEAALADEENFWARMAAATAMPLTYRIGTNVGNVVYVHAPAVQYTGLTYQSRDAIQTLDAGLAFREASDAGDDELKFIIA